MCHFSGWIPFHSTLSNPIQKRGAAQPCGLAFLLPPFQSIGTWNAVGWPCVSRIHLILLPITLSFHWCSRPQLPTSDFSSRFRAASAAPPLLESWLLPIQGSSWNLSPRADTLIHPTLCSWNVVHKSSYNTGTNKHSREELAKSPISYTSINSNYPSLKPPHHLANRAPKALHLIPKKSHHHYWTFIHSQAHELQQAQH